MNDRFRDKVALVSGAAQGIGLGVVRRLLEEGARVVAVDRSELVHELAGDACLCLTADLSATPNASGYWSGPWSVSAGWTSWSTTSAAPSGRSPTNTTPRTRSRPSCGVRCCPPCGVAERRCRRCWGRAAGRSSTSRRLPPAGSTGCLWRRQGRVNALTACLAFETADQGIRVNAVAPGGTDAPPRRIPRNAAAQSEEERRWYRQIVEQTLDSSLMKRYGSIDEQVAAIFSRLRRGVLHHRRDPAGSWR